MRDFRGAKAMAQTLREALNAKSVSLTHSESLELVAKILGFHDWNVLAARIQSENQPPVAEPGKPARQEIAVDAAILDAYVGFYLLNDNAVFTVTRDDKHLVTRLTGQRSVPITRRARPSFSPRSSTHRLASSLT